MNGLDEDANVKKILCTCFHTLEMRADPDGQVLDMYRRSAATILNKPENEVTPAERRAAKQKFYFHLYSRPGFPPFFTTE